MESLGQQVLGRKGPILALFAVLTIAAGFYAAQFRLTADSSRWLPASGEYAATLTRFSAVLPGSNRIVVALQVSKGDIWSQEFFSAYRQLTDDVASLPGIAPRSVLSLWQPGVRHMRMREDRIATAPIIPDDLADDRMTPERFADTRANLLSPGFARRFVAKDFSGAVVEAEFSRASMASWTLNDASRFALALEGLRDAYASDHTILYIATPWEEMGSLAAGLHLAATFALASFLLLSLCLLLWSRSPLLTLISLGASLTGSIWQLGLMQYLGLSLDPATVWSLAPVLLIGLVWGMMQLTHFMAALEAGASSLRAARNAFVELLRPGLLVLVVNFLGLAAISLVPIPALRDMASGAALGVIAMTLANLLFLPLLLASVPASEKFSSRISKTRGSLARLARSLARIGEPRRARIALLLALPFTAIILLQAIFSLPASDALSSSTRHTQDATEIARHFPASANLYTLAMEAPVGACTDYDTLHYLERLSWTLANVKGVAKATSLVEGVKSTSALWNEGNLKWKDLPRNRFALIQAVQPVPLSSGLLNQDCSILPVKLNLADASSDTLARVSRAASEYRASHTLPEGVSMNLAMGEMGERAGMMIELHNTRALPIALFLLVALSVVALFYRDWRALVTCATPLILLVLSLRLLMNALGVELSVASFSIPAFVLALGVMFVLHPYAQLRKKMRRGQNATEAYKQVVPETGLAVFWVSLAFVSACALWVFAKTPIHVEFGLLLGAGIVLAASAALILMPALAVTLEASFPRRVPLS